MARLEESLYNTSSDRINYNNFHPDSKIFRGIGYALLMSLPFWTSVVFIGDRILDALSERQYSTDLR